MVVCWCRLDLTVATNSCCPNIDRVANEEFKRVSHSCVRFGSIVDLSDQLPGYNAAAAIEAAAPFHGRHNEAVRKVREDRLAAAEAEEERNRGEAVAQHPSHPTGTLLCQEPRDDAPFYRVEAPNGASVRVLGTHSGGYACVQHGTAEGFIKSADLTFPALDPPTIETIWAAYQPGAQRVDVTLTWSPALAARSNRTSFAA